MEEKVGDGMWIIGYGSLIYKPPPHYSIKVNGYLKGFIRRFWQSSTDHRGTQDSPGRVVTLISLSDLKSNPRFHNDLHMYELSTRHSESELLDSTSSLDTQTNDFEETNRKISDLTEEDLKVWGCAYYIQPEKVQDVKNYLDIREQDGYTTHEVPFHIINVSEERTGEKSKKILDSLPRNENTGDYYIKSVIYIGTVENKSFIGPEGLQDTANVIKRSEGASGKNIDYLMALADSVKHLDTRCHSRDYYLEDLLKVVHS